MTKDDIKNILANLINDFLNNKIDRQQTVYQLIKKLDPEEIYKMDGDLFITDCYFAIKHLTEENYETPAAEMQFFAECFNGLREYSSEDKTRYLKNILDKE